MKQHKSLFVGYLWKSSTDVVSQMVAGARTSKDFIELLQSRVNDIPKANIYKKKKEIIKRNRFKVIIPLPM